MQYFVADFHKISVLLHTKTETTLISVNNLAVEFGVKPLFSDVSFVVNAKERVCLVGKNGAGKSTMLKIIAGLQKPTAGCVSIPNGCTIGYLPQVMKLVDGKTVKEEARTVFNDITKVEHETKDINKELARRTDYESADYNALIERLSHLTERLNLMGGQSCEAELERTLTGLGFEQSDMDRPTKELSGGWRMRIELAKLLLSKPDVLLLDEPTNHLDIWSIEWFEQFLQQSQSAVILVSHDRTFINHVCNRTLEINCGKVIDYHVKYDEYTVLRTERREQQLRAFENQQKEMADMKDFIERFRYKPTKAVQVQMRIRQLEKMVPIEIDEVDSSSLHLKFPPCLRSGDFPVICDDVRGGYPLADGSVHFIFDHVNMTIRRGEKVAFVGRNGEGKSTLVKCIMKQIPHKGGLKIGHNIQIGYYAQNEAQLLDDELSVFETIDNVATGDLRTRVRDLLGSFMFGNDAIDKKVKVLSGGERSRLAMLRLLFKPVNLLILDEPTNHLDMRTKDVLKEAVLAFDGTAIIVSHDRDFLDGLVDKVFEFGGGKVREHLGGIYDFLQEKKIESLQELERGSRMSSMSSNAAKSQDLPQEEPDNKGALSYEQQKELRRNLQKLEKQVANSEKEIAELEAALHLIEDQMATPQGASDPTLAEKHGRFNKKLEKAMEQWTTASEELEKIK